jgi:hypothetical protein
MIALEASKRKVKAYVRMQLPYYETSNKGSHDEKDDPKPFGVAGTWWHETLRILAAIEECVDLLRCCIVSFFAVCLRAFYSLQTASIWSS